MNAKTDFGSQRRTSAGANRKEQPGMDTNLITALGLAGLLAWGMIFAATIVADVLMHDPRPQGAPAPDTGMTAGGVPYVHGPRQEGTPHAAHRSEGQPDALAAAVHAP